MDNRFGTTSGMVIQTVMENGQEFCLASCWVISSSK